MSQCTYPYPISKHCPSESHSTLAFMGEGGKVKLRDLCSHHEDVVLAKLGPARSEVTATTKLWKEGKVK